MAGPNSPPPPGYPARWGSSPPSTLPSPDNMLDHHTESDYNMNACDCKHGFVPSFEPHIIYFWPGTYGTGTAIVSFPSVALPPLAIPTSRGPASQSHCMIRNECMHGNEAVEQVAGKDRQVETCAEWQKSQVQVSFKPHRPSTLPAGTV